MRPMRRLAVAATALALAGTLTAALAVPVFAVDCDGIALPDGCLFTITGGDTPYPDDGFAVTNADGVPMWDFVREQDLQAIGYPISQRWTDGPFTLQAFQKVILQWDPGNDRVNWYNTLDVLANKYPDVELPNVPAHQVLEADQGVTNFGVIMRNHLALLDANPKIKAAFLAEPNWLNLYGLPIAYEEREVDGNSQGLQVLRAQRTVFAIWNVPAPGTTISAVVLQNVPDKIKRLRNVIIPTYAKIPAAPFHESTADASHLDLYFTGAMQNLMSTQSSFVNLASQPWFPNRITERHKAWIVALQYFGSTTSYERPIEQYHIATSTISSSDAGAINVWIIRETPFKPEEQMLERIEQFVRISEDFIGTPFPTNDIVLTITGDYNDVGAGRAGIHLGSYIILQETLMDELEHELAHYYFNSSFAGLRNQWQAEGGADFLSAYVNDRTGRESIADLRPRVVDHVTNHCFNHPGAIDLHQLSDSIWRGGTNISCSPYHFGNLLFLEALAIVGDAAMGQSLGEIYNTGLYHPAADEELYRTLLRNAPSESKHALRELYRRLHGGPFTSETPPQAATRSIHPRVSPVLQEILPWAANPPDSYHADALEAIAELWWVNNDLMIDIASFDWLSDGVNQKELAAIKDIHRIAAIDVELGKLAVSFAWIVDDIKHWERWALRDLRFMVELNRDAINIIMRYPWIRDNLTFDEARAYLFLAQAAFTDRWGTQGTAETLATLPWISDGVSRLEVQTLEHLERVAAGGKDYLMQVLSVPWIADGISSSRESDALSFPGELAAINIDLAKAVMGLPWTTDGWDFVEWQALARISYIFSSNRTDVSDPTRVTYLDPALALQIVNFPWFTDGINGHELSALGGLQGISFRDVASGSRIIGFGWFRDNITQVEARAVHHLHRITLRNVDLVRQVLGYPWVVDGITESEVASLASMAS